MQLTRGIPPSLATARGRSARARGPERCLACVGGLALVTLLAYWVEPVGRLDARVLNRLAVGGESSLGSGATLVAHLGDPIPQLALFGGVCVVALSRDRPRSAVAAGVLVVGANLTTQILKGVLAHPRYQPILGYYQIGSTSFPSGHTTAAMSMVLAFVLVVPRRWRGVVLLLGACLVAAVGCAVSWC